MEVTEYLQAIPSNFLADINGYSKFTTYYPNQEALKINVNEHITDLNLNFTYKINEHGFRYSYNNRYNNNILFGGCSHTFGQGQSQETRWTEQLTLILSNYFQKEFNCINVGLPGSGPEVQILNLTWALHTYENISEVYYLMAPPTRHFFMDYSTGYCDHIQPQSSTNLISPQWAKHYIKALYAENSQHLWNTKTLWQFNAFLELAKLKNVDVYVSCWDRDFDTKLNHFRKKGLCKLMSYFMHNTDTYIDLGRDGAHAGPSANKIYAEAVFRDRNIEHNPWPAV